MDAPGKAGERQREAAVAAAKVDDGETGHKPKRTQPLARIRP